MRLTSDEERLLRAVVRAERPWADLEEIGICVTIDDETCQIDNPRNLSLPVTSEDLAHGIMILQGSPQALRRWAWFVQSSSSIYDLALEGDPHGELFLEAIWDLAFEGNLRPEIAEVAADLTRARAEGSEG